MLLDSVRVDWRAHGVGHGQWRSNQEEFVAPVRSAIGRQLFQVKNLTEGQPHIGDGADVEGTTKWRQL